MIVKGNQRSLFQTLHEWFADPAWPEERAEVAHTCEVSHGRQDHRTLERRSALHLLPLWPGIHQAMRQVTESWNRKTRVLRTPVTYALTSMPCD